MRMRTFGLWTGFAAVLCLNTAVLFAAGQPAAGLPALASVFHPFNGIWTDLRADAREAEGRNRTLEGLGGGVRIAFEADGTPHVKAETDRDAWMAVGYLHASFRLHQMDLMRRQAGGTLAEVTGRSALASDTFQRQLGLARHAEQAWNGLKPDSETRQILEAYAEGVNEVIREQKASGTLPSLFKLMGYEPEPWKGQDTLLLTNLLSQMMSFSKLPVYYAIWSETLGYERTMELMPVLPPNRQYPFAAAAPAGVTGASGGHTGSGPSTGPSVSGAGAPLLASHLQLLHTLESLPSMAVHENPSSNGWAVAGSKSASGKPLLAGDPHLDYSIPSIWFEVHVDSPGFSFGGGSVPGIPAVLVGRSASSAWTMTSGQNQQTFYYEEKTDPAKPDHYYWKGEWKPFEVREETVKIKGGASETIRILSSVHGPVLTQEGRTLAVDWLGSVPSLNMASLTGMLRAKSFGEFKEVLRPITAPMMNFLYADAKDIGVITAGRIPTFPEGTKPWLPMPGSGEHDRTGWVPYEQNPQSHNPPEGVISSANQRQADAAYPHYLGTSAYFDPGYRAGRIYKELAEAGKVDSDTFKLLQHDAYDPLASAVVPRLLEALEGETLSGAERRAAAELQRWNYKAEEGSSAASVWWVFWEKYLQETFGPWWEKHSVPVKEHTGLAVSPKKPSLVMSLEAWTLNDPGNPYFSNPVTGEKREAPQVMRTAFRQAVEELSGQLGGDPGQWAWSRLHTRHFPALTRIPSLGYGPQGSGGNLYSLDSVGVRESVHGPTWRMIADWGSGRTLTSYPGGQSENPGSPWYLNRMNPWWEGQYNEFLPFDQASAGGNPVWTLEPGGRKAP
ncbi:penicillin acylase family protein [Paenibacillus caseinilyticus]|uniref:Peptidase S45 n=2 Tax=Paenibacillus mucilaginosus K02 TaxID=997761 RepID=I0BMR2_9BACL|nr:penicillin acylase family protein [Paenibacillus mucilaginosus]AFH63659.1 peptidase S45 [Paenibacillus mucilaginosus K02]